MGCKAQTLWQDLSFMDVKLCYQSAKEYGKKTVGVVCIHLAGLFAGGGGDFLCLA